MIITQKKRCFTKCNGSLHVKVSTTLLFTNKTRLFNTQNNSNIWLFVMDQCFDLRLLIGPPPPPSSWKNHKRCKKVIWQLIGDIKLEYSSIIVKANFLFFSKIFILQFSYYISVFVCKRILYLLFLQLVCAQINFVFVHIHVSRKQTFFI